MAGASTAGTGHGSDAVDGLGKPRNAAKQPARRVEISTTHTAPRWHLGRVINAAQVKAMVKAVAEATPFVLEGEDPQTFTWYSIWSNAKDRPSKATYPLVAWDQWNTRLTTDENDMRVRTQLVRLMIVAQTATARTPEERDAMCNAADDAATNIVLAMEATYGDIVVISDVLITTMFDEFSTIETGVLLQFSVRGREAGCMEMAPGTIPALAPFTMALAGLTDVDIPAPTNGQVLTWNESTERWEASTPSGGGGGSFGTITGITVVGDNMVVTDATGTYYIPLNT